VDLAGMARNVIDTNRYMVLGTTEPDGRPRVSPVYFTHDGYRDFYWVSGPSAHHSENVRTRGDVAIVIYDSTVGVGAGRAVYLTARAHEVPDDELEARAALAWATIPPGGARAFAPSELRGDADLRLYVARATRHEVHIPGSDPTYGTGIDSRREVIV
jgi:nitroimidazol reductase NimA-like FMN-containing flavoprotein (pyridoxamine 5'-phosphate oxidase superfamily)